jgi:hypothetical protein
VPETAIDLALLAALVTAADTRIARTKDGQDDWTREIDLHLPVSNPLLWSSQSYAIKRLLDFLTGDRWSLHFRPRPQGMKRLAAIARATARPNYDCVSLFSGGLDSYIGAIDLLEGGLNPILVSQYDPTNSTYQIETHAKLKDQYKPKTIPRLRGRLSFPSQLCKSGSETTLRARSFLFFALAALPASALDLPHSARIHVPENGFISLNVPLDSLRLGAFSTRTTHPFYLAKWNELLSALSLNANLHNRYAFKTKGEMVAECAAPQFLSSTAALTMSCSSVGKFRWIGESPQHCGYCMPCLIRRGSLRKIPGGDVTPYHLQALHAGPIDTGRAEGEHIRSFELAIRRLKLKPASAARLIHLPGPLAGNAGVMNDYTRVYREGLFEVEGLLAGVVAKPL